jgi:soluble lytic murein transglycosylase-like protein
VRFSRSILATAFAVSLTFIGPGLAPATAAVPHTVQPGETLWSIAAANNFTTRTIAAYNGLAEDSALVAGSTIQIPSESEGASALGTSGNGTAPEGAAPAAPPPAGAYTVQPGDTLSGIAAGSGVTVSQLAWMNGLDPSAPLLAGTGLKLPAGSPVAAPQQAQSQPVTEPDAEPNATPATLTSAQIGQVAAQHGVSPSLAAAVAWQESGFNNGVISSANARGVMQVLPGTWTWVEQNLAGGSLDPNSALDNVNAGTMYLGQLLRDAGGDPALAAAFYYQGEGSVRAVGMLPETQRYVANVQALRGRFGG